MLYCTDIGSSPVARHSSFCWAGIHTRVSASPTAICTYSQLHATIPPAHLLRIHSQAQGEREPVVCPAPCPTLAARCKTHQPSPSIVRPPARSPLQYLRQQENLSVVQRTSVTLSLPATASVVGAEWSLRYAGSRIRYRTITVFSASTKIKKSCPPSPPPRCLPNPFPSTSTRRTVTRRTAVPAHRRATSHRPPRTRQTSNPTPPPPNRTPSSTRPTARPEAALKMPKEDSPPPLPPVPPYVDQPQCAVVTRCRPADVTAGTARSSSAGRNPCQAQGYIEERTATVPRLSLSRRAFRGHYAAVRIPHSA